MRQPSLNDVHGLGPDDIVRAQCGGDVVPLPGPKRAVEMITPVEVKP